MVFGQFLFFVFNNAVEVHGIARTPHATFAKYETFDAILYFIATHIKAAQSKRTAIIQF